MNYFARLCISRLTGLFMSVFSFFILIFVITQLLFNSSGRIEALIPQLSVSLATACIIIIVLISDILIPIPASIVMITSGMLFDGFVGGIIALTGALTGSSLAFYCSRSLGRNKIKEWIGEDEYKKLSLLNKKYGSSVIIITRMIPLAMESINAIAGLSNISFKKFILLNIIGYVPIIFLYTYSGALFKNQPQNIVIVLGVGFFIPLAIWHIIIRWSLRQKL